MIKTQLKKGFRVKITNNIDDGEVYHCFPIGSEVTVVKLSHSGNTEEDGTFWELTDGETNQVVSENDFVKS